MIEFYNGVSSGSNRTKTANFVGRGGIALGESFTAPNQDYGYVPIKVDSVLTNVIRLNISSSYGSYVNAGMIKIHATIPSSQPIKTSWEQPQWTSNSNTHGIITASGVYGNESPFKAFNGTMNGGSAPNCDNWSVKATSGWIELELKYPIYITSIEIYNSVSGSSNRTKDAHFIDVDGKALGSPFVLTNSNYAHTKINLAGTWTSIIRLNITSSYGTYVGAGMIKINAAV